MSTEISHHILGVICPMISTVYSIGQDNDHKKKCWLGCCVVVTIFLEKPFNNSCCSSYQLSACYNVRDLSRNICDPTKWLACSTNPTRPRSCCQFLPRGSQPRPCEHCFTRQHCSWRSVTSVNIIQSAFNSVKTLSICMYKFENGLISNFK